MTEAFENVSFTAVRDAVADAAIRAALPEIATAVRGLALPGFAGLVLGGGYGRGEGGATADHRLYNDLDFFVLMDAPEAALPKLAKRLAPISAAFGARLGLDVDFTLRTAARLRRDERRLMVQELLHAHVVVAPAGFDLAAWSGARLYAPSEIPAGEAARLLMNRGMGLDLARRRLAANGGRADGFVLRNLNKAVLGAGDARLIAEGRYAWTLAEREAALGNAAYARASAFKRRPTDDADAAAAATSAALPQMDGAALPDARARRVATGLAHGRVALVATEKLADAAATSATLPQMDDAALPPTWEAAFAVWCAAADALFARHGGELRRRSVRQLVRWLVRRRTLGPLATLGQDCTVRVLETIRATLADGVPPETKRDWEVFN